MHENNNVVLIVGKSSTGKSSSLRNLTNPEGVLYQNCESNKRLPFKSKFKEVTVIDPLVVPANIELLESRPDIHTTIIDTITFMMDQYETNYVLTAVNKQTEWGNYAQFFKKLMQHTVAASTKNIIMMAHTRDIMNEAEMVNETLVKVKGSLMDVGIESFFCNVIASKKLPISKLKQYQNELLTYTEEEEALGYKYVFQTRLTKETVNERIRSPLGMWSMNETYIDNDIQLVIDRLHTYFN